tara:strand:+ start:254 stop:1177 length:924 start_codon:yes stop_codon:yes gene_type:complete
MHLQVLINDLEKQATKELVDFLDDNLDTSNTNWWQLKVIRYLSPQQKTNSIKNDFYSLDLNALVSVFCANYTDFLTNNFFKGYELRSLALTIRTIRNSYAHQTMSTSFTSDTILYYLITYKIFLVKIHNINNVDTLPVIEDINKELLAQMERYQEAHGKIVGTKDEKIEDEVHDENKTLSYLEKIINDLNDLKSQQEKKTISDDIDDNQNIETKEEELTNVKQIDKIGIIEAKDILIGLREDIRRVHPDVPRENGILRHSMIQNFISRKINNLEKFNLLPADELDKTDKRHLDQLDKIFSIINRVVY